ncbi:unnamed protein product [Sympodiomycopsis kandeliae]
MVDYGERNFNTDFSGLITTVIIMAVVGGVCLSGFETLRQMKRLPDRHFLRWWRSDPKARHSRTGVGTDRNGIGDTAKTKTTQEDWEMGHLYHARTFHATTPSPFLSRWPLGWTWQSLRLDDWFYATHCGMDNVVYVRFLRGCVWWLLLQVLTTAPILLAVHFTFSKGVPLEDMSRASLAYLVVIPDDTCADPHASSCPREPNVQGRKLLWIHLCLLWYISATWCYTLFWIGKGSLKVRRRLVDKIETDRSAALAEIAAKHAREQEVAALNDERMGQPMRIAQGMPPSAIGATSDADSGEGWRQRTVLVTNLPATMRDESSLRRYFEEFLRPDDATVTDVDIHSDVDGITDLNSPSDGSRIGSSEEDSTPLTKRLQKAPRAQGLHTDQEVGELSGSNWPSGDATAPEDDMEHHLTHNVPHGPAPDLMPRRNQRSPVQTVIVVRKMGELSAMLTRRQDILQQLEEAHVKLAQNVLAKVGRKHEKNERRFLRQVKKTVKDPETGASTPQEGELKVAPVAGTPLDILTKHLARFVDDSSAPDRSQPPRLDEHGHQKAKSTDSEDLSELETVWEVLASLPRQLLDPYQPVTSLSALFRGQKVPSIDYLLTKLNLLTALITEMKARPPTEYEPTSSAFVTFRDPRQARMVWRELKTQIVMRVRMAPEVKDIDWDRIMRTSFTGDLVRGFGVNAFFWAFTVFWVIPVQIITTALFSVEHLKKVVPGLARFFLAHQRLEGFISVTLPTVIVSLITMSVPELVFQISKRAQGFVTWSSLYDQCLCRYWKFIVCNIVIFFCIGTTTLEAILQQIGDPGKTQIIDNIAFAFPTAAPFFVSYLILGLALHTGFELLGFMVPILQHFLSANKSTTPRARALRTLPRNFNRYYWLPFHILIMTIVFIFAILNPLIIPFALIYMFIAMIVFKKNFAFTYYRRFNEKDGVVYFVRLFRFTLDGLTTGQVVILIFFSVTDQEKAFIGLTAVLLPLTVGFKWLGTRLWKSQCRAIEDDEANAICGILKTSDTMMQPGQKDYGNEMGRDETAEASMPLDARASGRFPTVLRAPSNNRSRLFRAWQMVHDSFNANGADRPSYIARRSAQGKPVDANLKTGAKLALKVPKGFAAKAKQDGRHIKEVGKIALGVNKVMKMEAEQEVAREMREKGVESDTVVRRASKGARAQHEQQQEGHLERRATSKSQSNPRRVASVGHDYSTRRRASQKKYFEDGQGGMTRGESMRSLPGRSSLDEKPFLSGFEAVANHAPVASDDGLGVYDEYADGEESYANLSYTYSLSRSKSTRLASGGRDRQQHYPSLAETAQHIGEVHSAATPYNTHPAAPYSTSIVREAPNGLSSLTVTEQDYASSEPWSRDQSFAKQQEDSPDEEGDGDESDEDDDDDYRSTDSNGPVVRPHAKIKWDDTPNNQARYNNPFYSCELDPFLWLPRNPLGPLNLCDTIEWHGAALVSSDGGHGKVGEWEDDDDEDDEILDESTDGSISRRSRPRQLEGQEEIMMNSELAKRLEEEEDVHQVIDPAASLPKNVMDEYREAIRLGESDEEQDEDGDDTMRMHGSAMLERHSSNISATSIGSPAPSVRRELDLEFGRQNAMLPASGSQEANMTIRSNADAAPAPALPPGILQQQQTLGAGTTLRRDPSVSVPADADHRKTHFAPDPLERGRHGHNDGSAQAELTSPVTPKKPRPGVGAGRSHSHRGRAQEASIVSSGGASIRSTSTYGRTVTMRQALQAEVLEEERRRTIRDRLASKGSKKGRSMKRSKSGKHSGDVESAAGTSRRQGEGEQDEDDEATEGHIRHESEILARHQRAVSRRRKAEEREAGHRQAQLNVGGVASPTSPLHSRFSSMNSAIRRASTVRRSSNLPSADQALSPRLGVGHDLPTEGGSRTTSRHLHPTSHRRSMRREPSSASTVILHGSPLPMAATPVATSGAFPPLSSDDVESSSQGRPSPNRNATTTPLTERFAENLEMKEMKPTRSNPAPDQDHNRPE